MSSQPPAKRKRKNDTAESQESEAIAITKSEYWFDDGNVIVQVENTQFRVHRSMLSRHSSVFRDMFSIPQPANADESEQLDGCPLIHLTDKASDFEYVMSVFYDHVRNYDMRAQMPFEHCSAILRLGKKYDIEDLLNEGLKRFRHEFPSKLSAWDRPDERTSFGYEIVYVENFFWMALSLAHELSINQSLPGICLAYIQEADAGDIISSLKNKDAAPASDLLRQCLIGRDKILSRIRQTIQVWTFVGHSSPIPNPECIKSTACTIHRAKAVLTAFSLHKDEEDSKGLEIMDQISLPPEIDSLLCKKCRQSLEAAVERFRVELWRDLPIIFGLGESWDVLKDF